MSSRSANTLGQTRERLVILLVALSVRLIAQFFIYSLANVTGATALPVVGLRDSLKPTAARVEDLPQSAPARK